MTTAAENLSYKSLDLVPHYGVAHLAADGDPQPGFSAVIVIADNDEMGGVELLAAS